MALTIESERLLRLVFGDKWTEAWVSWTSNMHGKRVKRLKPTDLPDDEDCYFCVALLKPGATARKIESVARVHAMVIDDVGTKIDREAFDLFAPEPTWLIETSPGNYQAGYALTDGMDVETYKALRVAMRTNTVWGKSDGIDAVHLFRLPQGINTKHGGAVS